MLEKLTPASHAAAAPPGMAATGSATNPAPVCTFVKIFYDSFTDVRKCDFWNNQRPLRSVISTYLDKDDKSMLGLSCKKAVPPYSMSRAEKILAEAQKSVCDAESQVKKANKALEAPEGDNEETLHSLVEAYRHRDLVRKQLEFAQKMEKRVFKHNPFPQEFKLARSKKIKLQQRPILLDEKVSNCLKYIKERINAADAGHSIRRIGPLAITSMARSGKTTLLVSLFNAILSEGKYFPIFVNFNGLSNFSLKPGERDVEAFIRWVSTSLAFSTEEVHKASDLHVEQTTLEIFLQKAGKPIVLLLDELNNLAPKPSLSLAKILREMFLDKKGRYLVFTTHWFMDLTNVAGQRSSAPSPRQAVFESPPVTQDVEQINSLLKDYAKETHNVEKTANASMVAQYLGSVGLLFSVVAEGYDTAARYRTFMTKLAGRYNETGCEEIYPLRDFVNEFCTGERTSPSMYVFDELTTWVGANLVRWPLCFAKGFLESAHRYDLAKLIMHTENANVLPTQSGLPWEYATRFSVAIVGLRSTFFKISRPKIRLTIGLPQDPGKNPKYFYVEEIPEQIDNPKAAQEHLNNVLQTEWERFKFPLLLMAYPLHRYFTHFDTITCFKSTEQHAQWTGQQMKSGSGAPDQKKGPPPFKGVLIRGKARKSGFEKNDDSGHWTYLSADEVKEFTPSSIHPFIPAWHCDETTNSMVKLSI